MRRVTIETPLDEMRKFKDNPMFQKVRSVEVLQVLKEGPDEVAVICRVVFNDPSMKKEDFIERDTLEIQTLDHEREGAYVFFVRIKSDHRFRTPGGYLSIPFEIEDGQVRMTYLGNGKQIRAFLERVEKMEVKYRVVSIMDAKFPRNSPLSRLTEKQRRVLAAAYSLGYYDIPRRISSQELGERLKIGSSTVVGHRRRAERRLLSELMGSQLLEIGAGT